MRLLRDVERRVPKERSGAPPPRAMADRSSYARVVRASRVLTTPREHLLFIRAKFGLELRSEHHGSQDLSSSPNFALMNNKLFPRRRQCRSLARNARIARAVSHGTRRWRAAPLFGHDAGSALAIASKSTRPSTTVFSITLRAEFESELRPYEQ